jgi:hypothetical protein
MAGRLKVWFYGFKINKKHPFPTFLVHQQSNFYYLNMLSTSMWHVGHGWYDDVIIRFALHL